MSQTSPLNSQIRVAVIRGVTANGFWKAATERFVAETGFQITVVATGPKHVITPCMQRGEVDLLTMHACDAIINLVADGHACDPQPWLRNDLVFCGPASDPAQIRGLTDAVEALRRIIERRARFVVHASLGSQEVLRGLLSAGSLELDPAQTLTLLGDKHHRVLKLAAEENAYTLIGRIPFLYGKIPANHMQILVRNDPRLRRPYLLVTANPRRYPQANIAAARLLVEYLRSPRTQAWIAEYGIGQHDDQPLFFPIAPDACS